METNQIINYSLYISVYALVHFCIAGVTFVLADTNLRNFLKFWEFKELREQYLLKLGNDIEHVHHLSDHVISSFINYETIV